MLGFQVSTEKLKVSKAFPGAGEEMGGVWEILEEI